MSRSSMLSTNGSNGTGGRRTSRRMPRRIPGRAERAQRRARINNWLFSGIALTVILVAAAL